MVDSFNSPTFGLLSLGEAVHKITDFVNKDKQSSYNLIIGTDSQTKEGQVDFVSAIVIHRVGSGGIYFWQRKIEKKKYVLKTRIYQEATLSLILAQNFLKAAQGNGLSKFSVEIHVDIGKVGPTREMINEITGMIRGSGFACQIKPESYAASKVADRYT